MDIVGHGRSIEGTIAQLNYPRGKRTVGSYQSIQILRVVEKERPHIKFDFQEHLLGGVCYALEMLPASSFR